ncbi:hypothetical protein L1049_015349 [Liquidambar formosana]|uniref:Uncharacterized protein n=1 Tax=Liquidambar formosana TaxID=63359 RepID=A0AAP0RXR8_LIQFO
MHLRSQSHEAIEGTEWCIMCVKVEISSLKGLDFYSLISSFLSFLLSGSTSTAEFTAIPCGRLKYGHFAALFSGRKASICACGLASKPGPNKIQQCNEGTSYTTLASLEARKAGRLLTISGEPLVTRYPIWRGKTLDERKISSASPPPTLPVGPSTLTPTPTPTPTPTTNPLTPKTNPVNVEAPSSAENQPSAADIKSPPSVGLSLCLSRSLVDELAEN